MGSEVEGGGYETGSGGGFRESLKSPGYEFGVDGLHGLERDVRAVQRDVGVGPRGKVGHRSEGRAQVPEGKTRGVDWIVGQVAAGERFHGRSAEHPPDVESTDREIK